MGKPRLVISGSIAIDRIMNFSGNYHDLIDPAKLEVLSLSVLVESLNVSEGGVGANIAHYLAALGESSILLGSIGEDGLDYLKRLSDRGIDTTKVHRSRLPTASFNVLTDTSGNQVSGFYPGAMSDAESLHLEPLTQSNKEILVCISAHDPIGMRMQTQECIKNNLRLFYDPGQQVSTVPPDDLRLGVNAAEVLIVNEYELSMLLQRTGLSEEDLQTKVPLLISTHGEHGSKIFDPRQGEGMKVGIAKPDNIIDPTGAGDAYRAGFLYGYLRQWELMQCGQLGSVIASFALEHHGPQAPLSADTVIERYQKTFNERIVL